MAGSTAPARKTAQDILGRYARHVAGKPKATRYVAIGEQWFRLARPALRSGIEATEADVQSYARRRRALGAVDSTIDGELRIVRAMYRRSRLDLPLAAADLEVVNNSVAFSAELIAHLIATAKSGRVPPSVRAMLAVSTTYGARVSELCALTMRDVLARDARIRIPRRKKGVHRWQRIPEPILWAVNIPWRPCSTVIGAGRFHLLMRAAGQEDRSGLGWHAIRHGLAVALKDAGISVEDRTTFMGWKVAATGERSEGSRMAEDYAKPKTTIGLHGVSVVVSDDADAVDAVVWRKHPFAALWRRT